MENLLKYVRKVVTLIEEILNKSLYYANNKTCQFNCDDCDEHSLYDNNINICYYCNENEENEILFQMVHVFLNVKKTFKKIENVTIPYY